jgi:hypothetical protein
MVLIIAGIITHFMFHICYVSWHVININIIIIIITYLEKPRCALGSYRSPYGLSAGLNLKNVSGGLKDWLNNSKFLKKKYAPWI